MGFIFAKPQKDVAIAYGAVCERVHMIEKAAVKERNSLQLRIHNDGNNPSGGIPLAPHCPCRQNIRETAVSLLIVHSYTADEQQCNCGKPLINR